MMNVSYNPESTFFTRVVHHTNPRVNGWSAIGIHGLTLEGLEVNMGIKKIDLHLHLEDSVIPGELINARTIDHEKGPVLQVTMPPKQAMLCNWININDILGERKKEAVDNIICSGLFSLRTWKSRILRCNSCLLEVMDTAENNFEFEFEISENVKSIFRNGNTNITIF